MAKRVAFNFRSSESGAEILRLTGTGEPTCY
jgi:hypothetical protein